MEKSISMSNLNKFSTLFQNILVLFSFLGVVSILLILILKNQYAFFIITILWFSAFATFILPIRHQLIILWIILPFIDFIKRLAYYDFNTTNTQIYLILFATDVILFLVLFKDIFGSLTKPIKINLTFLDIAVFLFFLISLFSSLVLSKAPIIARLATSGMWVWPMVAYYLFGKYFNTRDLVFPLIRLSVLIGLVVALYGIRQFFWGYLPFEEEWFLRASSSENVSSLQAYHIKRGVFRTFATMDSHSSYGIFLGITLIFSWIIGPVKRHLFSIISYFILIFGLILSFTRFTYLMPIIAAAFIVIFIFERIRPIIRFRKFRRVSWMLICIIFSFFIFYLIMNFLYNYDVVPALSNPYLKRVFGTGTLSARLRIEDFYSAGSLLSLFGSGLANSSFFASKFSFSSSDVNFHNIFLDMIGSLGIIGILSFIAFMYFSIRHSLFLIYLEQDLKSRRLLIGLFSLVIGMLIIGHFNGAVFYFGRAIPVYFWAIVGILAHYQVVSPNPLNDKNLCI